MTDPKKKPPPKPRRGGIRKELNRWETAPSSPTNKRFYSSKFSG